MDECLHIDTGAAPSITVEQPALNGTPAPATALEVLRALEGAGLEAWIVGGWVRDALMWAALLHDIAKPQTFTLDDHGHGHFYGHPEAGAVLARVIDRKSVV